MISQRQLFLNHVGQTSQSPLMLEIERAQGVYMFDKANKKYLDLIAGVSVSNIGHCHPAVVQAVKDQAEKYMHLMVYGEYIQSPQVLFADLLSRTLNNSLDSVYFTNSGSEANEGALKLAKRYTGRGEIVAFKHAYHGGTHGVMSLVSDTDWTRSFRPLLPGVTLLDYNCISQLAAITEKTACVVIEAVQAEAGVIAGDMDFMLALRQRCSEVGALLFFDEVQTGFGRTGKLFGFQHFDIVPDIITLAKGMGGGMPIGAFVANKNVMHCLTHDPVLGHITTFGGHPVSAAAALANLQVIVSEKVVEGVSEKSALFASLLTHPRIKSVRRKGLLMAVELGDFDTILRFIALGLEEGFVSDWFLYNNTHFRIAPPLNITVSEIEESIEKINSALDRL